MCRHCDEIHFDVEQRFINIVANSFKSDSNFHGNVKMDWLNFGEWMCVYIILCLCQTANTCKMRRRFQFYEHVNKLEWSMRVMENVKTHNRHRKWIVSLENLVTASVTVPYNLIDRFHLLITIYVRNPYTCLPSTSGHSINKNFRSLWQISILHERWLLIWKLALVVAHCESIDKLFYFVLDGFWGVRHR